MYDIFFPLLVYIFSSYNTLHTNYILMALLLTAILLVLAPRSRGDGVSAYLCVCPSDTDERYRR